MTELEEQYADEIYRPGEEIEITVELPDAERKRRRVEIEQAFENQ
jgi:hypothetical protein